MSIGTNPKPGIYFDVPWDDYVSIPYMNPSTLKSGLRSMKRLKRAIDGEIAPPAKTVSVGSAVHCMIAGEADERIRVIPQFENDPCNVTATGKPSTSKATSYFKETSAAWLAENEGMETLTEAQWNTAKKVVSNIKANHAASELISISEHEATVIAEIGGVMCKTRIDGMNRDAGLVWDLKTTQDIEPTVFYRTVKKFSYLFQFGFHNLALAQAGDEAFQVQAYDIIGAEIADDYDVGVVHILPFDLIDIWSDKVLGVLRDYKLAESTGNWIGLYPSSGVLEVPEYDMSSNQIDNVSWGE